MIGFDIRSVHTEDYKAIEKLNSKLNNTKLKEIKGDKNCIAYAAQLNDDVIGYAIFHILNEKDYKRGIDIDDIFVEEMYRGLGVGHQLMIEVEKAAIDHKANYITKFDDNFDEEGGDFLIREGFNYNIERGYEAKVSWNK